MKNRYADVFSMLQSILGAENVYNLTPMYEVQYPFACMGEENNDITDTKTDGLGMLELSFDLWGENRVELMTLSGAIRTELRKLGAINMNIKTLKDTSTEKLLWRVLFDFNLKE